MLSTISVALLATAATRLTQASHLVSNGCRDLSDGIHFVKLMDSDDYPVIKVKCSNGYTILDYDFDSNLVSYFDTWTMWHVSTAGPTNDVHINWEEWYLPSKYDTNTKFLISPDCNTCDEDNTRQLHETQTTYWMTGTLFGCFWAIKGSHNCDVDWDTETCYTCVDSVMQDQGNNRVAITDESTTKDFEYTGICPHNVQVSNHYVPTTHDACTHEEANAVSSDDNYDANLLHFKPSIGTNGQYCVCTQPSATQFYTVDSLPSVSEIIDDDETEEQEEEFVNIELYQSDFDYGTYRIMKSGTYTIMEDITFDFNKPNEDNNENLWDVNGYLPNDKQMSDYPGANDYRDAFFLGFFAGITIECDNVILNLNGKTLKMSEYFYYQQRWFTTIELSTQYFLPGQGIGNFGAQPKTASNVIIKDGTLGLTSHHGIHGNYNNDIIIEGVTVKHFETHGIQFNGFDTITLRNVEVGPTSTKASFNGEYGHMRLLVPRYRKISDESENELIQFYGRENGVTMREITEEIELQMRLAWDYVVNDISITDINDENYESFNSAIDLFVNKNGIPNGGAQYGIFLNTFGASVFTYNLYTGYYSQHATLENIKIHGMKHEMNEIVRMHFYESGDIVINPFTGPLDVNKMFETMDDNFISPKYKGNIIYDAYIASNKFSDNFDYLQSQIILNDKIVKWATIVDDDNSDNDFYKIMGNENIQLGCNTDVMIHAGKGINGLRLDGVNDVSIKNIEISDLYDSTPVGNEICGDYNGFCAGCGTSGGHFRQTLPMQTGFSGNMVQAININAATNVNIENVNINNIISETGPAFGISIWPACDVKLSGDININNLIAGKEISDKLTYTYHDRPNKAPETCAMRVHWQYSSYTTSVDHSNANINAQCIGGHVGCHGTSARTMVGDYNDECDIENWDNELQNEMGNEQDISEDDEMALGAFVKDVQNMGEIDDNDNDSRKQSFEKKFSVNNSLMEYVPKQTLSIVIIELSIIILVIYGIIQVYKDKQTKLKSKSKGYSLLENKKIQNNYGSDNGIVVF